MSLPSPAELRLPHSAWRRPQEQLFQAALSPSCPQWLFAKAPPGAGKSAFATGLARIVALPTLILVRTLSLADQYAAVYGLPVLRGRQNFPCVLPGVNLTAADAPCTDHLHSHECPAWQAGACPYYKQREIALSAGICVTTYPFFLTAATFDATLLSRFRLLICDEGHNLISDLTRFDSATIPRDLLPTLPAHTGEVPAWARHTLDSLPIPQTQDMSQRARELRSKRRLLRRLTYIDPNGVYLRVPRDKGALQLAALWPTRATTRHLDHFDRTIVMSATLHPGGVIPRVMGLDDWREIEVASTFPAGRRPFYYWPQGRLGHDRDNQRAFQTIARAIERIMQRHSDAKGLIHVSSQWQAGWLERLICCNGIPVVKHFATRPGEREEIIEKFHALPAPAWLISPSIFEGQDFPGDTARVQVIAKTLFLDLSDPVTRARAEDGRLGKDWYRAEAVNRVTQAYGRVMRSEEDWGFTYGLDGTLVYLTRGRVQLPDYVMEAWTRISSV